MNETGANASQRVVLGVVLGNAVLLVYALFRPDSLDFSIPFLIAPSLALSGVFAVRDPKVSRTVVLGVAGIVVGLIAVIVINELTR